MHFFQANCLYFQYLDIQRPTLVVDIIWPPDSPLKQYTQHLFGSFLTHYTPSTWETIQNYTRVASSQWSLFSLYFVDQKPQTTCTWVEHCLLFTNSGGIYQHEKRCPIHPSHRDKKQKDSMSLIFPSKCLSSFLFNFNLFYTLRRVVGWRQK